MAENETLWDLYCTKCDKYLQIRKTRGVITKTALTHPHSDLDRRKHHENEETGEGRKSMGRIL